MTTRSSMPVSRAEYRIEADPYHERKVFASTLGRINVGSTRATLLAALAVCILSVGTAHAQFLFWPQYRSWWGDHAPFRHKHQHRHTKSELAKKAQSQDAPKGPLQIIISITDQRVALYDNGALIARSSVSTGVQGHPTPLGIFSVISKQRWHRSNIYSAAPMPYMQRITWSGIALHAGDLPGYPASHGCIRLTIWLCHSTLASHEARHARDHRARRCPAGRDKQSAPFCIEAEDRVRFVGISRCHARR